MCFILINFQHIKFNIKNDYHSGAYIVRCIKNTLIGFSGFFSCASTKMLLQDGGKSNEYVAISKRRERCFGFLETR